MLPRWLCRWRCCCCAWISPVQLSTSDPPNHSLQTDHAGTGYGYRTTSEPVGCRLVSPLLGHNITLIVNLREKGGWQERKRERERERERGEREGGREGDEREEEGERDKNVVQVLVTITNICVMWNRDMKLTKMWRNESMKRIGEIDTTRVNWSQHGRHQGAIETP